MTYLPTARLDEIAQHVLPRLLDSVVIVHHQPHILRVVGLLPNHYPYAVRVNIVADPIGGLWFTVEVENFYGLRDVRAQTFHGRYTNLPDAELLTQLRHLLHAFLTEVDLQPAPPGIKDRAQIRTWLTANTHTTTANIDTFMNQHYPVASDSA